MFYVLNIYINIVGIMNLTYGNINTFIYIYIYIYIHVTNQ